MICNWRWKKWSLNCLSLKLLLNVCPGAQVYFLLHLALSPRISAASVLPFDMEMCTLIPMVEDLPAQGTHSPGRPAQVESGRAEPIWSLFLLPSSTLLSEVLFLFWCSLSYLTFLPVLREISFHFQKQNKWSHLLLCCLTTQGSKMYKP